MEHKKVLLGKLKPALGLLIFSVLISILRPNFMTVSNLFNVLRQTSINAVIAAGMTFVILTGGIDLSVGSILAFSSAVAVWMLQSGQNIFLSLFACLFIGALAGLFNSIVITKGKVQPFIATLATMTLLRGATFVFMGGRPITLKIVKEASNFQSLTFFRWIGGGKLPLLQIPTPIFIMLLVFLISWHILNNTPIGRYIYAIGGNEEATKLSGLNVDKIKSFAYIINALLASLAGMIVASRLLSAQPTAGDSYELDAIAAVVLGGTSLAGGQGSVLATILGALIIGVLNNALNLLDVSSYYQMIVKAIVILIAVLLDRKQK